MGLESLSEHLDRLSSLHNVGHLTAAELHSAKQLAIHHHSGIPWPVLLATGLCILVALYLVRNGDQAMEQVGFMQELSVRELSTNEWRVYEIVASSKASLDAQTNSDIVLCVDSTGLSVFEEISTGYVRDPPLVFVAHSEILTCETILEDSGVEGYICFKLDLEGRLDFLSRDANAIKNAYAAVRPASVCNRGERIDVLYARTSTGHHSRGRRCVVLKTAAAEIQYYDDVHKPCAGCEYTVLWEVPDVVLREALLDHAHNASYAPQLAVLRDEHQWVEDPLKQQILQIWREWDPLTPTFGERGTTETTGGYLQRMLAEADDEDY
jgi:hypothetical protein